MTNLSWLLRAAAAHMPCCVLVCCAGSTDLHPAPVRIEALLQHGRGLSHHSTSDGATNSSPGSTTTTSTCAGPALSSTPLRLLAGGNSSSSSSNSYSSSGQSNTSSSLKTAAGSAAATATANASGAAVAANSSSATGSSSSASAAAAAGSQFLQHPLVVVSAAKFHSAAMSADGVLYTWGWGRGGRLGHPDFVLYAGQSAQLIPRPVEGLGKRKVVSVATAKHHTLVATSAGEVWSW